VTVSVVVPLFNEQDSIKLLHSSITSAIASTLPDYEIIFVDDGSSDDTFHLAKQLAADDARLRVLKFRRNYGQTPAMAAGIDHACGDIIVTRKIPSKIANWLIGKVTGVPIKDNGCSLKAYRAETIKNVPLYNEMHRFIPAMAAIAGPRLAEIKVRHHARQFGESKYGLSRIYKVLLDLMTIKMVGSFASKPLYWFSMLSLPFLIASMFMITGSLASAMFGGHISIPIAGSGLIFFALAAFLIIGGAIGELIYKTGTFDAARYPLLTARTGSDDDSAELQLTKNQNGQIE